MWHIIKWLLCKSPSFVVISFKVIDKPQYQTLPRYHPIIPLMSDLKAFKLTSDLPYFMLGLPILFSTKQQKYHVLKIYHFFPQSSPMGSCLIVVNSYLMEVNSQVLTMALPFWLYIRPFFLVSTPLWLYWLQWNSWNTQAHSHCTYCCICMYYSLCPERSRPS